MNRDKLCPYEAIVTSALRDDGLTEDLKRHVAECDPCSETVYLICELKLLSSKSLPSNPLCEIRRIWLKAQIAENKNTVFRIKILTGALASFLVVLGIGVAIRWDWSNTADFLPGNIPTLGIVSLLALALLIAQDIVFDE